MELISADDAGLLVKTATARKQLDAETAARNAGAGGGGAAVRTYSDAAPLYR